MKNRLKNILIASLLVGCFGCSKQINDDSDTSSNPPKANHKDDLSTGRLRLIEQTCTNPDSYVGIIYDSVTGSEYLYITNNNGLALTCMNSRRNR